MATKERDETIRNRIAAAVMVTIAIVVVMALTDFGPFADRSESDRARFSVERFFAAYNAHDFATLCGLLSPAVRRQIDLAGATATSGSAPKGCEQILAARLGSKPAAKPTAVRVDDVRVSGNRGVADLVLRPPQGKAQSESLDLELDGNDWVVSSPQLTQ